MIYSLVLVNKPVIDSDRNEKMGRIKRFVIDPEKKRVLAFILAPDPGQTALEIIPYTCVKSVYNNAVIVQNLSRPIRMSDAPEIMSVFMKDVSLLGTQVLTDTGMLAGTVRDFAFREKDGALVRLSLIPEKEDGPTMVGAKHVLKIVKARIMLSALGLTEPLEEEEQPEEYVEAAERKPEPVAEPETPAEDEPEAVEPEPVSKETVAADEPARRERPAAPAAPSAVETAPVRDVYSNGEDTAEFLRQLFQELSSIIMARLESIDVETALESVKEEIIEALKQDEPEESGDGDLSELEILVEEKIKRGAGRHLEEIKGTLATLAGDISGLAAGGAAAAEPDPALAEIRDAIGKLESRIDGLESRVDPEKPAEKVIAALKEEIGGLRSSVPDPSAGLEAVQKSIADLADQVGGISKLSAAIDEIKGSISGEMKGARELVTNEMKSVMDRLGEAAKPAEDSLTEEKMRALLEDLAAALTASLPVGDVADKVSKLSSGVEEWKKGLVSELEKNRERFAAEIRALVESRLAESADRETKREDRITEMVRKLDNRMIELREQTSAATEKFEGHRDAILDEIKSFTESVVKPEDLVIIQKWVSENKPEMPDLAELSEDLNTAVDAFRTSIIETSGEIAGVKDAVEKLGSPDAAAEKIKEAVSDVLKNAGEELSKALKERAEKMISAQEAKLETLQKNIERTVLKPEDMTAVRQWLEDLKARSLNVDAVAGEVTASVDGMKSGMQQLSELLGKIDDAVAAIGSSVPGKVDETARELSSQLKVAIDGIMGDESLKKENLDDLRNDLSERLENLMERINGELETLRNAEPKDTLSVEEIGREFSERLDSLMAVINGEFETLRNADPKDKITVEDIGRQVSEKMESFAAGINGEIESLRNSQPKQELTAEDIGREISSRMEELAGRITGDLNERLESRMEEQAGRMEKLQDQLEASLHQLRDGFRENIENRLKDFAKMGDIEALRDRVEQKVGDITDNFVERIEKQLDERDEDMEQGFQTILKRIEKALQKSGSRSDLGNLFGSGGLLDGIFGGGGESGSQVKIPSRTSRGASRSAAAASGIEDSQIRRLAYLIGRKLRQDITDAEGNVLAREGDTVDEEMIRLMRDKHCTLPLIRGVDFS